MTAGQWTGRPSGNKSIVTPTGLAAAAVMNLLHYPVTGLEPGFRTLAREGERNR